MEDCYVYIVLSQPKTIESAVLKAVTGDKYCHAALCLNDRLEDMYTFSYLYANVPLLAGFVKESLGKGIFADRHNLDIVVMKIKVSQEIYRALGDFLEKMYNMKEKYFYNYFGVIAGAINKVYKHANWFYCSEFVRDVLVKFNIINCAINCVIRPIELLNLSGVEVYYIGKQREYQEMLCAV